MTQEEVKKAKGDSIKHGGFFDTHPILVPASIFLVCWIPYLIIFFRKTIAFGDLGGAYPLGEPEYWILFVLQLGICVISHSLTIRTIVRLYAHKWLIYGSIAFYALSPAWGLMTVADIRHPLFAAVFCVFTSSAVFALFSKKTKIWVWIQLGLGALCVCLLRSTGAWMVIPALLGIFLWKLVMWWQTEKKGEPTSHARQDHLTHPPTRKMYFMDSNSRKSRESIWSDVCASFLVFTAVGLLFTLTYGIGWGLPLGDPSYGAENATGSIHTFGLNLTGSSDIAGIIPISVLQDNSVFPEVAVSVARFLFAQQCFPLIDLTFSWIIYLVLFFFFFGLAIYHMLKMGRADISENGSQHIHARAWDARPLIIALPIVVMVLFMAFTENDCTLRYIMPMLAAQPMFFASAIVFKR